MAMGEKIIAVIGMRVAAAEVHRKSLSHFWVSLRDPHTHWPVTLISSPLPGRNYVRE